MVKEIKKAGSKTMRYAEVAFRIIAITAGATAAAKLALFEDWVNTGTRLLPIWQFVGVVLFTVVLVVVARLVNQEVKQD